MNDIVTSRIKRLLEAHAKEQSCIGNINDNLMTVFGLRVQMGEDLLQQKITTDHGEWEKWLSDNMPYGGRQARRYMYIAKHKKLLIEQKQFQLNATIEEKTLDSSPEPPNFPDQSVLSRPKPPQRVTATRKQSSPPRADKAGAEIPENLTAIFDRAGEIQVFLTQLVTLKNEVAGKADDELWTYLNQNIFKTELENVIRAIRFTIPYAVCRICGGSGGIPKGACSACRGCGWINKPMYEQVPEDMK